MLVVAHGLEAQVTTIVELMVPIGIVECISPLTDWKLRAVLLPLECVCPSREHLHSEFSTIEANSPRSTR
jgi:hypothetical protein